MAGGSMHGREGGMHGREGACMAGGMYGMHTPLPDTTRYDDKVNERAVRILLECIFVFHEFAEMF